MEYTEFVNELHKDESQNSNPKIPRVENLENEFKSKQEEVKPGKIPYYKKKKLKKLNDLDKYLIFSFTVLILFTIAILVLYFFTHDEPAVLVGCFFTAFGGEVLLCARIKKYKLHKEAELSKKDTDVPY